ncbi:MAG: hypothetical protein Q8Q35_02105 [Nanoarchaeota archaeon]|nr:hypothetical protein [Nanoarchaeota archaeon]
MKTFFKKSFTKKKGEASMVAMVLLIMFAIVAGVMVTSFSQKSTDKVSDKIVEIGTSIECNDIRLSIAIVDGDIIVKNRGTLGVDQVVLRKYEGDEVTTNDIKEFDGENKLLPGVEFNAGEVGGANKVEVKPVFVNSAEDLIGCNAVGYDI